MLKVFKILPQTWESYY